MSDPMKPLTRRNLLRGGAALGGLWALSACAAGGGGAPATDAPSLGGGTDAFLKKIGPTLGTTDLTVLAYAAPQADAIKAIIGQFTELTGIKVRWTSLDEQSAVNRAAVALGSGSGGYDVVQSTSGLVPTYVEREWLADMTKLKASSKATVPAWDPAAYGKGTTAQLSVDGRLYAAPSFIGTQIFFYRTDIFEAKKVEPPTTLGELRKACRTVHSDSVSAIALRSAPSPSQLMFVWSAWLYAFGGRYYDSYRDGAYSGVAIDSPEALQALELYIDLTRHYAPTGSTNWSVEDVTRAFTTGQVAMVQEGAVFGDTFNDPDASRAAGKVGTFAIPAGPEGSFVPYNAHGWSISAKSKAADAAWLFTQWATLSQTLTAATTGKVAFSTPPLASVYDSPAYRKRYAFDDFVDSVKGTIATANKGGFTPFDDASYLPRTSRWNTLGQRVSEELSKAVTGQTSAAKALQAAARAMGS
ncbi:MAG: extracellular solute-binding protein [Streptosporangiales bacterium]|nr:extracellular solute-binding protein [Streptosporangiales bacterium]